MRLPLLILLALALGFALPRPQPRRMALPEPPPRSPVRTLETEDGPRTFLLHRAPGRPGPQPAVLMLHGRGDSAAGVESTTGWNALADREGFTVVYPVGEGRPRTFDSGWGEDDESPDVRFLRALVDDLPRRWAVEPSQIYVCGFSSGGMMTARLAAAMPERLGAVGIVAGTVGVRRGGVPLTVPRPAGPIPAAVIHGAQDERVPYLGGGWRDFLSVAQTVGFFLEANGAQGSPRVAEDGPVTLRLWTGPSPRSAVLLVTVEGLGHQWLEGRPGQPLSIPQALWTFFRRFRAP